MAPRGLRAHDDSDDDEFVEGATEREENELAYCPDCGAHIWDAADVCPKCFAYIGGNTSRHPPQRVEKRAQFRRIVVFILMLALLLGSGLAFVLKFVL